MIEAVPMPPYIALMTQVFTHAPHMLELDWTPLVGALVVREKSWNKLTPDVQRELARAAAEAGRQMKARNRLESDMAVGAMKKRKLRVTAVSPAVEGEWRRVAERNYPRLRGQKVPADLFDEITRLVAEYRRDNGGAP
jgi:TRAP-type C4-dicarboxylate transport system substrate-binding protein